MDDSTILFSLCVADVLKRELTESEIYSVKKGIEWGLGETQWDVIGAAIDNLDTREEPNDPEESGDIIEIERDFYGNDYKITMTVL